MDSGHYNWTPPNGVAPGVLSAAYFPIQRGWKSRKIQNTFWAVDFTVEDAGLVRVGSTRVPWQHRRAGIVHLYPPGTPYWEDTTGVTSPTTACFATFLGGKEAGLSVRTQNKYNYARFSDPAGRIASCIRKMALAGRHHGEQGFWLAQAALGELVHIIGQASPENEYSYRIAPDANPGVSDMVSRAREYFQTHLPETIRLADMADHLHMSPSAFSHRFRAETGQSPMAYLTECRIRAAHSLLLRGQTLAEIADKTGFHDAYHLSKTFKKVLGVSPRDTLRGRGGNNQ